MRVCCRTSSAKGRASSREGKLRPDGVFAATTVLAKHDENYMPREVVDALKQSGHWQEGGATSRQAVGGSPPPCPLPSPRASGVQARDRLPGFPLSRE